MDMKILLGQSWMTSLGAVVVAVGYGVGIAVNPVVGEALKAAGTALIGFAARDNKVSTEQAQS